MRQVRGLAESAGLAIWEGMGRVGIWVRSVVAGIAASRPPRLSSAARVRVVDLFEGDLLGMVEDATEREITERSAVELLTNDALICWLLDGEVPGAGAAEFLEDQVALFNRARHDEERQLQQALRDVLELLLWTQAHEVAAGRWQGRDPNREAAMNRARRRFGQRLDELRIAKKITIGELSERSRVEVVRLVAFIYGAEEPGSVELLRIAAALDADPRELIPEILAMAAPDEDASCRGGED